MSDYVIVNCSKCDREYKVKKDVILSCSGRKDILCSTCGDVLIIAVAVRGLKKEFISGVSR